MSTDRRPLQTVIGSVMVAAELAEKGRQLSLGVYCEDAIRWAHEAANDFAEIAGDAKELVASGDCYISDGEIDPSEWRQLRRRAERIEELAAQGVLA